MPQPVETGTFRLLNLTYSRGLLRLKRNWQEAALAHHFSLSFDEFELLANKAGPTRLGFAVLLKFFQYEARFPNAKNEVPRQVVAYLAPQVDVEAEAYLGYYWQGRSIKYHRAQIRQFLGFRETTSQDLQETKSWLLDSLVWNVTGKPVLSQV